MKGVVWVPFREKKRSLPHINKLVSRIVFWGFFCGKGRNKLPDSSRMSLVFVAQLLLPNTCRLAPPGGLEVFLQVSQ